MLSCSEDLAEEKKFAGVVNATPSPGKDGVEDEEKSAVRISDERTLMESSTDNLPAPVDNQYPQGLRLGFIVVALVMSVFLVALDLTILGTAIPKIVDEFGQLELVGWYTSSFLITMAAFQSAWGKAFKYFPLKPGFIFCICIFELGSLICGAAPTSTILIVGRAIAGFGAAGVVSGSYIIVAVSSKPKYAAALIGVLGASYGLASIMGPLLGGVFATHVSWRCKYSLTNISSGIWLMTEGCFYINLPIGAVSAAIIFVCFHTPPSYQPVDVPLKEKVLQMDPPGTLVLLSALICFILAMQWGGQDKLWSNSNVIGCLVGFGLLIIAFVLIEMYQGERAMMVPRLVKKPHLLVGMIYVFFVDAGFFIPLYYIPIYFQVVFGVSASESGIRSLPFMIAGSLCGIIAGIVISVTGRFVPVMYVGSIFATVGCALIFTFAVDTTSAAWIGYQILAGIGSGLSYQVPVIAAQALVDAADLSSITAMVVFTQTIGSAFFVTAASTALNNTVRSKLHEYVPNISVQDIMIVDVTKLHDQGWLADEVASIIEAYMDGLQNAFLIAVVASGIGLLSVLGYGFRWKNLKRDGYA